MYFLSVIVLHKLEKVTHDAMTPVVMVKLHIVIVESPPSKPNLLTKKSFKTYFEKILNISEE